MVPMPRVLCLLLAVVTVACGGSLRGDDGRVVREGQLSAFDLRVGDCFERPDDAAEVTTVTVVPCARPHDSEVFAVAQHPGADAGPYPGAGALQSFAQEVCLGETFLDYVGVPYAESELTVFPITPTAESWRTGDRSVACVLSGDDLAGSARRSGV